MPVSNIFGDLAIQPKSIQDYDAQNLLAATHAQALQTGQLNLLASLKKQQDDGTIRNALLALGPNATDDQRIAAYKNTGLPGGFAAADTLEKGMLDRQKTQATAAKDDADAEKTRQATDHDRMTFALQGLAAARTPADATTIAVKAGLVPFDQANTYQQSIPTAPDGSIDPGWKRDQQMKGVSLLEQVKLGMPLIQTRNTGGSTDTLAVDPMTGQARVTNTVRNTQSPDSAASNANQLRVAGIHEAGQNARNAATIQKDYRVAGMDPQGNFVGYGGAPTPSSAPSPGQSVAPAPGVPGASAPQVGGGQGPVMPSQTPSRPAQPLTPSGGPQAGASGQPPQPGRPQAAAGPMDALVDAIGTEKISLQQALSRMPPGMKSAVMGAVSAKYPNFDPTAVVSRQAAARAFGPGGQLGNTLRSLATANEHLDQLDQLGDALKNGNLQLINKIGNAFGVQTGQAAPAVFDAVKNIVGQEVVKAIVANGGSQAEREEAGRMFASASSPAQLKQTIAAYRNVMGAQHQNLLVQRRAAGLPDATLPDYAAFRAPAGAAPATSTSSGGATGSGLTFDRAAIDAELKRRGH